MYTIWKSMRQRCINPNNSKFHIYGARGISVCEEWDDYINFKNWALNNGYSDDLTIDRKDNDKDYCPSNCRWVTYVKQNRNRRDNVRYEYNAQNLTLTEWSEIVGIPYKTLWRRIHLGWSIEKTLTTPLVNKEK